MSRLTIDRDHLAELFTPQVIYITPGVTAAGPSAAGVIAGQQQGGLSGQPYQPGIIAGQSSGSLS